MSVTRYHLTIPLVTVSPLHSGGTDGDLDRSARGRRRRKAAHHSTDPGQGDETTVQEFVRDTQGRPVLTGRSVKGALRAAWRETFTPDPATDTLVWGDQDRASAITVETVTLPEPTDARAWAQRVGIAVNRYWGTAGDSALFTHEILAPGSSMVLEVSAQTGSTEDDGDPKAVEVVETALGQLLGLIKEGRLSLGGRRGAGWGRVRLADEAGKTPPWTATRSTLSSVNGLLAYLGEDQADAGATWAPTVPPVPNAPVRVTIHWTSPSGILVAQPLTDEDKETLQQNQRAIAPGERPTPVPARPLRVRPAPEEGPKPPLVLPGSSIRGALRQRATRIARTVIAAKVVPGQKELDGWDGTDVHDQLAQDPRLVRDLFGSTELRGALTVLDTLATGDEPAAVVRTHNAGDRWTGGVKPGGLFQEEVPRVAWAPLELEVDLRRVDDPDRRRAAICLLGLVLAELTTGTLPLGSRGTRGYGEVTVTGLEVQWPDGDLGEAGELTPSVGTGRELAQGLLEWLRKVNKTIGLHDGADGAGSGWASYLDPVDEQEPVDGRDGSEQ